MTHDDISAAEIEAATLAYLESWVNRKHRQGLPTGGEEVLHADMRAAILASRAALLAEERKVVAREPTAEQRVAGLNAASVLNCAQWFAMWDTAP